MSSTIKNTIIIIVVALILFGVYYFYFSGNKQEASLVSSLSPVSAQVATGNNNASIANDFLVLLLGVRSIKLNDAIFSDTAFSSLHDSSILLTKDAVIGRPNPFAPLGSDPVVPSTSNSDSNNNTNPTNSSTPVVPPVNTTN